MRPKLIRRIFGPKRIVRCQTPHASGQEYTTNVVTGYMMIVTPRPKDEADKIRALKLEGTKLVRCDTVTGPFDIIVHLEAPDINTLDQAKRMIVESYGIGGYTFSLASPVA